MKTRQALSTFYQWLNGATSVAPLVVFRIGFGLMMFAALVRFAANGWINSLFIQPRFFFTYHGFEWVKPLPGMGMYLLFALMLVCSLMIATGFFYRIGSVLFFLLFTYMELIDKTNYLNHYYFISIMAGLLCLLPANRKLALDNRLGIAPICDTIPRWAVFALQLQMVMVYFFAGIAKINADWLLHAMPLKIWLPVRYDVPLIGALLTKTWVAYAFSWLGMLFDVTIGFLLFYRRTTRVAYAAVVVFHALTAILFPVIGMFPFIMIVGATVFLPAAFHQKILGIFTARRIVNAPARPAARAGFGGAKIIMAVLALHFAIQVLLPLRQAFYPGNLFYNEEGYRFSWRVMLMEKTAYAVFVVKDGATGKAVEIKNSNYLTRQQEKQMATQPDMVLQFGRYLGSLYKNTFKQPQVYVEDYVSLNGRASCLFIDPQFNLMSTSDNFSHKKWVIAGL